jgi:pimeloyl-ACP methyl ester carboxylesterase
MIALLPDIAVGYDDNGTGVPVVFIHGFPHNRTLWAAQLRGLSGQARCVSVDLRGFGETTAAAPWTVDQFADDVVGLLDLLRIDRAVVAGLSMGGYVALATWRRHVARVRGLVLANTRAGADSAEGKERRRSLVALAKEQGPGAVVDAMAPGMIGKTTRAKNPEVVNVVQRMMMSTKVEGVVGGLQAMMERADSTPTLETIDVPTLIITGDEDAIIPVEEARALHGAVRGSRLEIIGGAGHLSNVERPAAFNHVVAEFLARLQLA